MNTTADMRIPVHFGTGSDAEVVLLEGGAVAPAGAYTLCFSLSATRHAIGCACCTPRGPAATALAILFRARATGAAPFFHKIYILASPAGEAAIRDAIETEVMAGARFCLG